MGQAETVYFDLGQNMLILKRLYALPHARRVIKNRFAGARKAIICFALIANAVCDVDNRVEMNQFDREGSPEDSILACVEVAGAIFMRNVKLDHVSVLGLCACGG
jgi:hypothetical protein